MSKKVRFAPQYEISKWTPKKVKNTRKRIDLKKELIHERK